MNIKITALMLALMGAGFQEGDLKTYKDSKYKYTLSYPASCPF